MTVTLTKEQWAIVVQLMNQVSGMENAKVLLPIYEAIVGAISGNAPNNGSLVMPAKAENAPS